MDDVGLKSIYELTEKWQKCLRLQDWDIVVKIKRMEDMPKNLGECVSSLTKKQAIISLLEPNDTSNGDFPYDMEETLVHELLHIHFIEADDENGCCPDGVEQAIEEVARALIKLDRKGGEQNG